jgi:hypothetical protein
VNCSPTVCARSPGALGEFIAANLDQVNPVVASIIESGAKYIAADAHTRVHRLVGNRHDEVRRLDGLSAVPGLTTAPVDGSANKQGNCAATHFSAPLSPRVEL